MARTGSPELQGAPGLSEDAPVDEEALARELLSGDKRAAYRAWRHYYPVVRGTLRRIMGPDSEIEDLAQEVYLRFFGKLAGLRKQESMRSFLIGIAVRVAQEEIRRRGFRRWLRLSAAPELPEVPADPVDPEVREALRRLYALLDSVSAETRVLFVLRHMQEMELAEIAAALGLSFSTARRRLDRMWERMSRLIARDPALSHRLEALAQRPAP